MLQQRGFQVRARLFHSQEESPSLCQITHCMHSPHCIKGRETVTNSITTSQINFIENVLGFSKTEGSICAPADPALSEGEGPLWGEHLVDPKYATFGNSYGGPGVTDRRENTKRKQRDRRRK